jgi:hypothetical protein
MILDLIDEYIELRESIEENQNGNRVSWRSWRYYWRGIK